MRSNRIRITKLKTMKVQEAMQILSTLPPEAELIHASSERDLALSNKDVPVRHIKLFTSGLKSTFVDKSRYVHETFEIVGGSLPVVHLL